MIRPFLLFCTLILALPAIGQHTITYIANEGILIQSEEKTLLIDAIFDDYYEQYAAPSEQTIHHMNAKESPYQTIDLLLITHAHLDHFNPAMVGKFMTAHRETVLVCPNQAIDSIAKFYPNTTSIKSRLNGVAPIPAWQSLFLGGISMKTAFVRHGGKQNYGVDNQIYLMNVDGKKILHIGDAEMDMAHFSNLHLAQPPIDVALIPYWFLAYSPGVEIIRNQIKSKKLIAIHYPKVGDPKSLEKIRENFPQAVVFMKEGKTVEF